MAESKTSSLIDARNKANEVFANLKIDQNKVTERVERYKLSQYDYPKNYYKRICLYFDLNDDIKVQFIEYEILGKVMEYELLKAKILLNTDNCEFLDHWNIPFDEFSIKKRLILFENELKSNYNDKLSPIENEKIIRLYFGLQFDKLSPEELERLDRIMKGELLIKKYSIKIEPVDKEKRLKDHSNVTDKLIKDGYLKVNDVEAYFGLGDNLKKSSNKLEPNLLVEQLKNELVNSITLPAQKLILEDKQIPADDANRQERFKKFKNDISLNYRIGEVKYFIANYFGKNAEEISENDVIILFKIIRSEVNREMIKEPNDKKNELQRILIMMNNELKKPKIKFDKNAINDRLKRFNETISPDYKSGLNKLNYRDRIAAYYNINLDDYLPNEIEKLGRIMDNELNNSGLKFISNDDQFLQDKKISTDESKRNERIKRFGANEDKIKSTLKNLDAKIIGKYYDIDTSNLDDSDLVNFSAFMMDEVLNEPEPEAKPKLEETKKSLIQKGIDLSPNEREKRKLKFKNEIEPELKSNVKELDYNYIVSKYFNVDFDKLSPQEKGRFKRLMDKEIRQKNKEILGDKLNISFDTNAKNKRLKKFKDQIEPDYMDNLRKLNYQDRIALYFDLKADQLLKDDIAALGKLMEDEIMEIANQYPTDSDLYLIDLNIPISLEDKKKRIQRLKTELETNPIECTNPAYLLKIYFDLKDLNNLNEDNLKRLTKIMEEEQIYLNGDLITNELNTKTDIEKLLASINLLRLRDSDKLKNCTFKIIFLKSGQDGQKTVNEFDIKLNKTESLNEVVMRLEKENAAKINEIKTLLEHKRKSSLQTDQDALENLKKELEKELKQQDSIKNVRSSEMGPDEKELLVLKLEKQKKMLEEQRNARIKEEAERLRKKTEEKYRKKLELLNEEEKLKELRDIEELERAKNEMIEKRRQEHLERKKRLEAGELWSSFICSSQIKNFLTFLLSLEAEKANLDNQRRLNEKAKKYDMQVKMQLDAEKRKLDEEFQKVRESNHELAKKLKQELEDERGKVETSLFVIERKIKEIRATDEEERKNKLRAKAKELEEENTKKLKDEATRLEVEANEQIKEITAKLEEEMNSPEKKNLPNIEEETNNKRIALIEEINETNRKKLDDMSKKLEEQAIAVLDELAAKLDEEIKKRLEKQLEEAREEHKKQAVKLQETLKHLMTKK